MSYLLSAGLLVLGTVTATTGLVSDLWDLNDFVYHKYAAYTLAVLALVHVYLHWGRLVAYARWRLGKRPGRRRRLVASPSATAQDRPFDSAQDRPFGRVSPKYNGQGGFNGHGQGRQPGQSLP